MNLTSCVSPLHSIRGKGFIRTLVFVICISGLPFRASAQSVKSSWTNLSVLEPGQKIQVTLTSSKKEVGTFSSVTPGSLTIQAQSGLKTLQRQDIRIVRTMKNNHRLRNTLIGAGFGAGVGTALGAATFRPCTGTPGFFLSGCIGGFSRSAQAGIFGIAGLLGGATVGVLWPTHEIIYRAGGS